MIEFLKGWVLNIVTLVMLIVLLEILVPSGRIKKFVNLISGFILIIAIINPVLSLLNRGVDLKEFQFSASNFIDKKEIESNSKVLTENQMKQITRSYRNKLIQQVKDSTLDLEEVADAKVDIIINEDYTSQDFGQIKRVYLSLTMKDEKTEVTSVARVEKVEINTANPMNQQEKKPEKEINKELKQQIENKIVNFLDIPKDTIVISLENS